MATPNSSTIGFGIAIHFGIDFGIGIGVAIGVAALQTLLFAVPNGFLQCCAKRGEGAFEGLVCERTNRHSNSRVVSLSEDGRSIRVKC